MSRGIESKKYEVKADGGAEWLPIDEFDVMLMTSTSEQKASDILLSLHLGQVVYFGQLCIRQASRASTFSQPATVRPTDNGALAPTVEVIA